MSNVSDIMAGLVTVLQNNITGLKGYDRPVDSVQHFPAAILLPESIEPEIAIGGNSFKGVIRIVYLVAAGDDARGFALLYDAIDPTAASASVIKAVRTDPTLNGKVDSSGIMSIINIGRRKLWEGFYFGFDAMLEFIKSA